jgi:hypothetical protein
MTADAREAMARASGDLEGNGRLKSIRIAMLATISSSFS